MFISFENSPAILNISHINEAIIKAKILQRIDTRATLGRNSENGA
jgi:hypothetical protein